MRAAVVLGLAEEQEVRPGISEDVITESPKLAEVKQRTEAFTVEGEIIPRYRTTTSVSVLSDGVIKPDYSNLRYVLYAGVRWSISTVTHEPPRMTIFIGEVYNGPTPGGAPDGP